MASSYLGGAQPDQRNSNSPEEQPLYENFPYKENRNLQTNVQEEESGNSVRNSNSPEEQPLYENFPYKNRSLQTIVQEEESGNSVRKNSLESLPDITKSTNSKLPSTTVKPNIAESPEYEIPNVSNSTISVSEVKKFFEGGKTEQQPNPDKAITNSISLPRTVKLEEVILPKRKEKPSRSFLGLLTGDDKAEQKQKRISKSDLAGVEIYAKTYLEPNKSISQDEIDGAIRKSWSTGKSKCYVGPDLPPRPSTMVKSQSLSCLEGAAPSAKVGDNIRKLHNLDETIECFLNSDADVYLKLYAKPISRTVSEQTSTRGDKGRSISMPGISDGKDGDLPSKYLVKTLKFESKPSDSVSGSYIDDSHLYRSQRSEVPSYSSSLTEKQQTVSKGKLNLQGEKGTKEYINERLYEQIGDESLDEEGQLYEQIPSDELSKESSRLNSSPRGRLSQIKRQLSQTIFERDKQSNHRGESLFSNNLGVPLISYKQLLLKHENKDEKARNPVTEFRNTATAPLKSNSGTNLSPSRAVNLKESMESKEQVKVNALAEFIKKPHTPPSQEQLVLQKGKLKPCEGRQPPVNPPSAVKHEKPLITPKPFKYTSDESKACPENAAKGTKPSLNRNPKPIVEISAESHQTPKEDDITKYSWFYDLDKERANAELKQVKMDGIFLIRPSTRSRNDSPYTLCVWHNGSITNVIIRRRPDLQFAFGTEKNHERAFPTLQALVDFHRKEPIFLIANGEVEPVLLLASPKEQMSEEIYQDIL